MNASAVLRFMNKHMAATMLGMIFVIIIIIVAVEKSKKSSFGKSNVIELYHAKWCGFCTEFVPNVFDPVTKEFKGLIVKKYEADKNAAEISKAQPSIRGFPTVRMNGEEYNGDRTVSNFRDFIKRNMN